MNTPLALTSGPVPAHLIRLAIPASLGMLFNTLYNLTDLWFAGLLSDDALAAVSIAGSVFFLILAIGFGMQTGVSAVVSPELGRKQSVRAAKVVDNALGLGLLLSVLFALIGLWSSPGLVRILGAQGKIEALSLEYLLVTFIGTPAFVASFVLAGALIGFGDTRSNRNALAVGFCANFLINPLLTFVLDMGVSGLAWSTVLIKLLSTIYLAYALKRHTHRMIRPKLDVGIWLELLRQIIPAGVNMLSIILGGFITVSFIGRFGSEFVAGYAVGLRLEQVLLLPALGLNSAVLAIAGQNFGAGKSERVIETYYASLKIGAVMTCFSVPIMLFLSPLMMSLFSGNESIITTGSTYLRVDAVGFFAYVVLFLSTACLQAIQKPGFPMVLGLFRHLLLPAVVNFIFIVQLNLPLISVFVSLIIIVLISAILSHKYTQRTVIRVVTNPSP